MLLNRMAAWRSGIQFAGALAALILVSAVSAAPAQALNGAWAVGDHAKARLVFGGRDAADPQVLSVGLQIQLQEGWETYWHYPGDAGVPTAFDWDGTVNVTDLMIDWPVPVRTAHGLSMSYTYRTEVVLPLRIAISSQMTTTRLRLALAYGVCKDVCQLVEQHVVLDIPATADRDANATTLIAGYQAKVPLQQNTPDFAIERVLVGQPGAPAALEIVARALPGFVNPEAIIEGPEGITYGRAVATYIGANKERVLLRVPIVRADPGATALGATVSVTILDDTRAIELEMPVQANDN